MYRFIVIILQTREEDIKNGNVATIYSLSLKTDEKQETSRNNYPNLSVYVRLSKKMFQKLLIFGLQFFLKKV